MQLVGMLDSPYVRRTAISLARLGIVFEHRALSVFGSFDDSLANARARPATRRLHRIGTRNFAQSDRSCSHTHRASAHHCCRRVAVYAIDARIDRDRIGSSSTANTFGRSGTATGIRCLSTDWPRRVVGCGSVASTQRTPLYAAQARCLQHVAKQRALLNRVIECHMAVRGVVEPGARHGLLRRFSIRRAEQAHREGLDVER